jgi:hypothetical protein
MNVMAINLDPQACLAKCHGIAVASGKIIGTSGDVRTGSARVAASTQSLQSRLNHSVSKFADRWSDEALLVGGELFDITSALNKIISAIQTLDVNAGLSFDLAISSQK